MTSEILKPCPFCGGEAAYNSYGAERYNVFCNNPESAYDDHACHFSPELKHCDFDSLDAAIKAWNLRADRAPAADAELLEALKTLVHLNDNYSGFGGEIIKDRIDNAWHKARQAITRAEAGRGKDV